MCAKQLIDYYSVRPPRFRSYVPAIALAAGKFIVRSQPAKHASHRKSKKPRTVSASAGASNDALPVTDLARALGALKESADKDGAHKKEIDQLNGWFEIALHNMARGLSMFDAEQRLIVCNRMYREIFDLPERLTRRGTPLVDIVRYHVCAAEGI